MTVSRSNARKRVLPLAVVTGGLVTTGFFLAPSAQAAETPSSVPDAVVQESLTATPTNSITLPANPNATVTTESGEEAPAEEVVGELAQGASLPTAEAKSTVSTQSTTLNTLGTEATPVVQDVDTAPVIEDSTVTTKGEGTVSTQNSVLNGINVVTQSDQAQASQVEEEVPVQGVTPPVEEAPVQGVNPPTPTPAPIEFDQGVVPNVPTNADETAEAEPEDNNDDPVTSENSSEPTVEEEATVAPVEAPEAAESDSETPGNAIDPPAATEVTNPPVEAPVPSEGTPEQEPKPTAPAPVETPSPSPVETGQPEEETPAPTTPPTAPAPVEPEPVEEESGGIEVPSESPTPEPEESEPAEDTETEAPKPDSTEEETAIPAPPKKEDTDTPGPERGEQPVEVDDPIQAVPAPVDPKNLPPADPRFDQGLDYWSEDEDADKGLKYINEEGELVPWEDVELAKTGSDVNAAVLMGSLAALFAGLGVAGYSIYQRKKA